jgi:hypothetical protein
VGREKKYYIPEAESTRPVPSVCWTAKQPPNGPATAVLRQRTVQMSPVDARMKCQPLDISRGYVEAVVPPMQLKSSGI